MGGDKRPAFQFYPGDWMADPDLQSCSLAAQGLWIFMLCVMHYAKPYGHLVTKTGEPMPIERLARLSRSSLAETDDSIAELQEMGVFSVTDLGMIYSRRMVSDGRKFIAYQQSGATGGRKSVTSRQHGKGGVHTSGKGGVHQNGNPPVPEDENTPTPTPTPSPTPPPKKSTVAADSKYINRVVKFWTENELTPRVIFIGDARRSNLLARRREVGETMVFTMLKNRAGSKFLSTEIMDGRGAGIDWCFGPKNFVKILDGNYNDESTSALGEKWMVDTYRQTDWENHSEHDRWNEYTEFCAEFAPRSAIRFDEWIGKEKQNDES